MAPHGVASMICCQTHAAPFRPAARECRPESTIVRGEVRSTLRPLVDGQLVTEGEILGDEISSFPRQQPRDREPQSEPEPHACTLPNGGSRNLRHAQSRGGSDIRAPQVPRACKRRRWTGIVERCGDTRLPPTSFDPTREPHLTAATRWRAGQQLRSSPWSCFLAVEAVTRLPTRRSRPAFRSRGGGRRRCTGDSTR